MTKFDTLYYIIFCTFILDREARQSLSVAKAMERGKSEHHNPAYAGEQNSW